MCNHNALNAGFHILHASRLTFTRPQRYNFWWATRRQMLACGIASDYSDSLICCKCRFYSCTRKNDALNADNAGFHRWHARTNLSHVQSNFDRLEGGLFIWEGGLHARTNFLHFQSRFLHFLSYQAWNTNAHARFSSLQRHIKMHMRMRTQECMH